jgi:hypothetical protein
MRAVVLMGCFLPLALGFVVPLGCPTRQGLPQVAYASRMTLRSCRRRVGVCALVGKDKGGKGGKIRVPYKEKGGGSGSAVVGGGTPSQGSLGGQAVTLPVTDAEIVAASLDEIKRKVEEAQKMIVKTEGEDSLEKFISSGQGEVAPEKDLTLTGRIPSTWLDVDFSVCLGKGGYGDVFEATITDGPLKGSRAVAKRAYYKSKGKVRWRGKDSDGNSISATATTSGSGSSSGSSSGEIGNADEYLEVEDYINRCPRLGFRV